MVSCVCVSVYYFFLLSLFPSDFVRPCFCESVGFVVRKCLLWFCLVSVAFELKTTNGIVDKVTRTDHPEKEEKKKS